MTKTELKPTERSAYFARYIDKLSPETRLKKGFESGREATISFFKSIPDDKLEFRYAPGKWTIKEVLQHIVDTERIFMYRCFRIARNDKTSLMGYDQDTYIEPSRANEKSLGALLDEYTSVRQCFISLLGSLSDADLMNIGAANESPMSARTPAFITLGHEIWHIEIIKERYLND